MTSTQQTTVSELVLNYRQALNALIPSLQAARILDEDLIGYDDWSRVCDTLYSLLVVEPIRSSLDPSQQADFDLPCYDTEYESYEHFGLILASSEGETISTNAPNSIPLLHRFTPSNESPRIFDLVETIRVDDNFRLIEDSFESHASPFFICAVPNKDRWRVLDEITVKLD
ncbi:MAG: hypothetical protein KOO62_06460 [candidate division Zixibacteria bacterium]|nr:hypothetical protein [candidate division Zixibacteria bacterium]